MCSSVVHYSFGSLPPVFDPPRPYLTQVPICSCRSETSSRLIPRSMVVIDHPAFYIRFTNMHVLERQGLGRKLWVSVHVFRHDCFFFHSLQVFLYVADAGNHAIRAISAVCSFVCENNGTCIGPDSCQCRSGWMGYDCSIPSCEEGLCGPREVGWHPMNREFYTESGSRVDVNIPLRQPWTGFHIQCITWNDRMEEGGVCAAIQCSSNRGWLACCVQLSCDQQHLNS